jgi:hypothetical protein
VRYKNTGTANGKTDSDKNDSYDFRRIGNQMDLDKIKGSGSPKGPKLKFERTAATASELNNARSQQMPMNTGSSPDGKRFQKSSIDTDGLMKFATKNNDPKFKFVADSHNHSSQLSNQRGSVARRAIATAANASGKNLVLSHEPATGGMNQNTNIFNVPGTQQLSNTSGYRTVSPIVKKGLESSDNQTSQLPTMGFSNLKPQTSPRPVNNMQYSNNYR